MLISRVTEMEADVVNDQPQPLIEEDGEEFFCSLARFTTERLRIPRQITGRKG